MTQSDPNTISPSGEAVEDARKAGADIAGSLRDSAHDAAGKASAEVSRAADKVQAGAAEELKDVASALRTAAEEMRSGSLQDRAFSELADGFADVSDALRDMEVGEMLSSVNGFARRNPLVFLGGAALVGFAATRAAKASATGSARGSSNDTASGPKPAIGNGRHRGNATPETASAAPASAATPKGV